MIRRELARLVREAVRDAGGELGLDPGAALPPVELERPKRKEFGDFSTNVALAIASRLDRPPREVAETIVAHLPEAAAVERAEVAGPGFVNLFVTDDWLHQVLRDVIQRGEAFGRVEPHGRSVQVEFTSANPTGPLHVGHARQTVLGDALASILEAAGWRVEREYYFNDAGRQMDLFAASVEARYLQALGREAEVPEDGYHGDYLADIARDILDAEGPGLVDLPPPQRRARLLREGTSRVLANIKGTLERLGVAFDVYFSERTLHESGAIRATIDRLLETGHAYEAEDAIWFRSSAFGDEKDRVLIRSNGEPTYFAADCAYLVHKFDRGFDHLIYVWGADHHGTVKRLLGAAEALGYDPARVEVVLHQLVSLSRGGEPVRMSKRAGELIAFDELLDEVGEDAARFTLLAQSPDSPINVDIEVVKRQTMDNPVYYVQYGHARIASILRKAAAEGVVLRPVEDANLSVLSTEPELHLLEAVAELPDQVATAAEFRAPHRLTHFAQDLAARFHRFYTECRVISEDDDATQARLWLCAATKRSIGNVLGLLGVSAPEAMERMDD